MQIQTGRRAISAACLTPYCHLDDGAVGLVGGPAIDGTAHAFSDVDVIVVGESLPEIDVALSANHRHVQYYGLPGATAAEERTRYRSLVATSSETLAGRPIIDHDRMAGDQLGGPFHLYSTRDYITPYEKVDVEYYTGQQITSLFGRVRQDFERCLSHKVMEWEFRSGLSELEAKLLYRLSSSVQIAGSSSGFSVPTRVQDELSYLLFRHELLIVPQVAKIFGTYLKGQFDTSFEMSRRRVVRYMRAFCFANGIVDGEVQRLPLIVKRLPNRYQKLIDGYTRLLSGEEGAGQSAILRTFELTDEIMQQALPLIEARLGPEIIENVRRQQAEAGDLTYFDAGTFLRRIRNALVRQMHDPSAPPLSAVLREAERTFQGSLTE